MRGAETSKIVFPCGRSVQLHKSASFKMTFETKKKRMNQKYGIQIDSKTIERSIGKPYEEMMQTNIEQNHPKYIKFSEFGFKFGASCLKLSQVSAFLFGDMFVGNIWGVPYWSDVCNLLKQLGATFPKRQRF